MKLYKFPWHESSEFIISCGVGGHGFLGLDWISLTLNMQYYLAVSNYCNGKNTFISRGNIPIRVKCVLIVGLQKPILSLNLSWIWFSFGQWYEVLGNYYQIFGHKTPSTELRYISPLQQLNTQLSLAVHLQKIGHKCFLSHVAFNSILANETHHNMTYDAQHQHQIMIL